VYSLNEQIECPLSGQSGRAWTQRLDGLGREWPIWDINRAAQWSLRASRPVALLLTWKFRKIAFDFSYPIFDL
jgi:hypothetical protein